MNILEEFNYDFIYFTKLSISIITISNASRISDSQTDTYDTTMIWKSFLSVKIRHWYFNVVVGLLRGSPMSFITSTRRLQGRQSGYAVVAGKTEKVEAAGTLPLKQQETCYRGNEP